MDDDFGCCIVWDVNPKRAVVIQYPDARVQPFVGEQNVFLARLGIIPFAVRHIPVERWVCEDEVNAPLREGIQHFATIPHIHLA
jgi:hypothetical protein